MTVLSRWNILFARDSMLWVILFYVGMCFVLSTGMIENPEDYGLSVVTFRWMKLIAAVITALAGKLGMSPVELARNQNPPKD